VQDCEYPAPGDAAVSGRQPTALVFDIDNTLTPPRQPIEPDVVAALSSLVVPFHVAAGSHKELLDAQFFEPMHQHGFRGSFDAFVGNGATRLRADYTDELRIETVSQFDLRAHLGERHYDFLVGCLQRTIEMPEFALPDSVRVVSDRIAFRGSMVNFCPMGRLVKEDPEAKANRDRFVAFDRATGYRQRVIEHLRRELAPLVGSASLTITLGGQTSFDIGVEGEDKSKAVRTLLAEGACHVTFIGDALFDGGNDWAVARFAAAQPDRVTTVQVGGCRETLRFLREAGYRRDPSPGT
jgi:hydroxymethylpyrimidine pyrophosphatase-like HAD family hydrolase